MHHLCCSHIRITDSVFSLEVPRHPHPLRFSVGDGSPVPELQYPVGDGFPVPLFDYNIQKGKRKGRIFLPLFSQQSFDVG